MHDAIDIVQQVVHEGPLPNAPEVFTPQIHTWLQPAQMADPEVADIDDTHPVSARQQLRNQHRSEITRPAGDENVHVSLLSASTSASTT